MNASTSQLLSGIDLAEMDGCNISLHFVLRLVDSDLLDKAVRVLRADGTIVEIVGDDDEENVEEFPGFMVKLSMERAFFWRIIFVLPEHVLTKEQLFIEIETIQKSSNALKKCMFLEKDDDGRAKFGRFLNHR